MNSPLSIKQSDCASLGAITEAMAKNHAAIAKSLQLSVPATLLNHKAFLKQRIEFFRSLRTAGLFAREFSEAEDTITVKLAKAEPDHIQYVSAGSEKPLKLDWEQDLIIHEGLKAGTNYFANRALWGSIPNHVALDTIAKIETGKARIRKDDSDSKCTKIITANYVLNNPVIFQGADLPEHEIIGQPQRIDAPGAILIAAFAYDAGDLGKAAFYYGSGEVWISNSVHVVKVKATYPEGYVYRLFHFIATNDLFRKQIPGGADKRVTMPLGRLSKITVPSPGTNPKAKDFELYEKVFGEWRGAREHYQIALENANRLVADMKRKEIAFRQLG